MHHRQRRVRLPTGLVWTIPRIGKGCSVSNKKKSRRLPGLFLLQHRPAYTGVADDQARLTQSITGPTPSSRSQNDTSTRQDLPRFMANVCRPDPCGCHSASFCSTVSSRVIVFSQVLCGMLLAIIGQHYRLIFSHRLQMDRPGPYALQIGQCVGGMVEAKVNTRMLML